jgi:hypothetical protein
MQHKHVPNVHEKDLQTVKRRNDRVVCTFRNGIAIELCMHTYVHITKSFLTIELYMHSVTEKR